MPSPFEQATRVAISEIILKHVTPSKFGHFLSAEAQQELCDDIYELLLTSRRLKAAGDKVLAAGQSQKQFASNSTVKNLR